MLKTLIKLPLKAAFLPLKLVLRAFGILSKDDGAPSTGPSRTPPSRFEDKVEPGPEPDSVEIRAQDVLASMLDTNPVFLDVREIAELSASGKIEGAVHIPLRDVPRRFEELNAGDTIVVYCAAGRRSFEAAMFLRDKGFSATTSLTGGLPAWTTAGGATVPG